VLAAGGIGTGRQMAAGLALGAQGAWTGSIWLTVAEADTPSEAQQNILAADSRATVRSRAMTGKPARQLRTAWTEAWESEAAPKTLPMPLQGILYGEMARRVSRAHNKELAGFPVGQIVGRMDRIRPTQEVVLELVEECIATVERMCGLLDTDG
jgi:NAD(P)H-dependent flavin oxidoreductase YrpB (nitropropane dioxygenase family)